MHVIVYSDCHPLPPRYVREINMDGSVTWTIDRWHAQAFVDYQSAVTYLRERGMVVSASSFYPVVR